MALQVRYTNWILKWMRKYCNISVLTFESTMNIVWGSTGSSGHIPETNRRISVNYFETVWQHWSLKTQFLVPYHLKRAKWHWVERVGWHKPVHARYPARSQLSNKQWTEQPTAHKWTKNCVFSYNTQKISCFKFVSPIIQIQLVSGSASNSISQPHHLLSKLQYETWFSCINKHSVEGHMWLLLNMKTEKSKAFFIVVRHAC